ncbi:MAG TPA: hypothetical protein ENN05_10560 [Deltaproteobacteria bacterium]|nr:hypothetical protein [Deltaproteobacteria bacterium]
MSKVLRIGLKYCGGCSPCYDRVGTVNRIKEELGGMIEFVSPEREEAKSVLVISGCKTACADISLFSDRPIRFISSEDDASVWIEEMKRGKQ